MNRLFVQPNAWYHSLAAWSTHSPACCTVNVALKATPLGLNTKRWFALPVHVATLTADPFPPLTCRHFPSMTEVIVPF